MKKLTVLICAMMVVTAWGRCLVIDKAVDGLPEKVCIGKTVVYESPTKLFKQRVPKIKFNYSLDGITDKKDDELNLVKKAKGIYSVSTGIFSQEIKNGSCSRMVKRNIVLNLKIDESLKLVGPVVVKGSVKSTWDSCHASWETQTAVYK